MSKKDLDLVFGQYLKSTQSYLALGHLALGHTWHLVHLALSHTWHSVTLGIRSHLALDHLKLGPIGTQSTSHSVTLGTRYLALGPLGTWSHLALSPIGTRSHLALSHLALGHLAP